ncbi:MAG: hypothetical protein AAGI52_09565 [Bacteroidota bacterium]
MDRAAREIRPGTEADDPEAGGATCWMVRNLLSACRRDGPGGRAPVQKYPFSMLDLNRP